MRKDGGAAFPRTLLFEEYDDAAEESRLSSMNYSFMEGMSLRDHVAVEIAKQFITNGIIYEIQKKNENGVDTCKRICQAAFNFAEIFCEERANRRGEDFKNEVSSI